MSEEITDKERQENVEMLQTIADALNESLKRYREDPSEENYQGLMDVSEDIWGEEGDAIESFEQLDHTGLNGYSVVSPGLTSERILELLK